jgi:7,8-dihydropterin-6-yl-methyl-4-(beta-D-ribofuranosyl)aminobenzene 5'-phosphate synthase
MTTPGALRLTIVCENTVGRPLPLLGEHGFACLLDCTAGRILFDTGRGATLLPNLAVLGIDPASIEAIVLSHGHDDHSGGLLPLLDKIGPRPVYAHPGIFAERYHVRGAERRAIGMQASPAQLEVAGARLCFLEELTELGHGLWFSGPIPRRVKVESGDPALVCLTPGGEAFADPFPDDAALAVETSKGLVIVLGCAHAGMINTVEHFRGRFAQRPIHVIIGGTHLGSASAEQFEATVAYLQRLGRTRLCACHCTGLQQTANLQARLAERVFFASAGSVLEV